MKLVLCVWSVAIVAPMAASASATVPSTVGLASRTPAEVSGIGFAPGTPVRLVVTSGTQRLQRTVHARANGRLIARWTASLPACSLVVIRATAPNVRLLVRSLPASTAACGGPTGPPGPPVVAP
jgi:hypothetical protein